MTIFSRMPRGPGILLQGNSLVPPERFGHISWGAAYLGSARMSEQIANLRAAGARDIYLWAHPSKWGVTTFEASVAQSERLCAEHGLTGYIADSESSGASSSIAYFWGTLLRDSAKRGLSVGFTSFASERILPDIAEGCQGEVWGLCQIYNQSSNDAQVFQGWLDRFKSLFGNAIFVVATFIPPRGFGSELSAPDGFELYLTKLPSSQGYASFGTGPAFMSARLAFWREPDVFDSAMWVIGIPTVAHMPLIYSIGIIAVVALAIALYYLLRKRL